jgi:response regulator RpfG family c-di-GMP phosphodiesterase
MTSPVSHGSSSVETTQATESATKRLLVVDDEEGIRAALSRFFRGRGYEVTTTDSATSALDLLARQRFAIALCDVRMPGMTGVELVPRAHEADPDLAIVMLSGVNDAPTATDALTHGALDYLMKPIELVDLADAVERALHKRDLMMQQRAVERMIREEVDQRTAEVEREKSALRALTVSVAETLIHAMEAKDMYLLGHSQRVAEFASTIATQLGLNEDTIEQIRIAGRLHDVGKIGIRESVLNKPGSLTPDEFEHIKDHVRIGMEILAPLSHLGDSLEYVHDHHEHWDGGGYPRGRKGTEISVGGRVLAAADAFDALTSKRAYRDPMSADETIEFLRKHVGKLLDPDVFEAMRTVVARRRTLVFIDPHV